MLCPPNWPAREAYTIYWWSWIRFAYTFLLDKKIKQELRKFGGKHIDSHDSDARVTCMITDSNINEETED